MEKLEWSRPKSFYNLLVSLSVVYGFFFLLLLLASLRGFDMTMMFVFIVVYVASLFWPLFMFRNEQEILDSTSTVLPLPVDMTIRSLERELEKEDLEFSKSSDGVRWIDNRGTWDEVFDIYDLIIRVRGKNEKTLIFIGPCNEGTKKVVETYQGIIERAVTEERRMDEDG